MKKIIEPLIWITGIIALFFVIILLIFMFSTSGNRPHKCGMTIGPIYGTPIKLNKENLIIEKFIELPEVKLGFMNISDTIAPKLISFDKSDCIIWAVEFKKDPSVGIPYKEFSDIKLIKNENGVKISFFNNSHSESGKIYLTKNYNLEYMCLSPF